MQKAEPQQRQTQHRPAQRPGGVQAESPQGEQIARLDALMQASPAIVAQRKLFDMIHSSTRQATQQKFFDGLHDSPAQEAQRKKIGSRFGAAQRVAAHAAPAQPERQAAAKPNNTGLPDNLKSGIEHLSGMSLDNVKVHYNSSQPAQLNALAYAQGTDIHVAPGQEQHLPHEAWHVVQQAQGRVQPTMQLKDGVAVNDDKSLEHEADVMGGEAVSIGQQVAQRGKRQEDIKTVAVPVYSIQLLKDSEITTTEKGNGISKQGAIYLKTHRPAYAEGQVAAVWNAAKDGAGKVFCPNSGNELFWDEVSSRVGKWDMGHKPGHEYSTLWENLATCVINFDTFMSEYQDPNNYQPEDPSANRSHAFEL